MQTERATLTLTSKEAAAILFLVQATTEPVMDKFMSTASRPALTVEENAKMAAMGHAHKAMVQIEKLSREWIKSEGERLGEEPSDVKS